MSDFVNQTSEVCKPEYPAWVCDEGGIDDVKYTRLTQVLLDVNDEDYYGPHEEDNENTRVFYGAASESAPRVLIYAGGRT